MAGVVKDTSGLVLPGVTVQIASPAMIEKVRDTVTDGTGQYRFVDLRPGTYSVTATLTGFNTFKRDNVEVSGTAVFTINADLKVGSIEETVTVSGETPVVDLQSTSRERVMSAEVLESLPTGRWYAHIGVLVPGVTSAGRDVGGTLDSMGGSLAAHGGPAGDQRITQNGLNVMTLQTGTGGVGGMLPNTTAAQEVAIDTTSASAERQTGGVNINFIPRDGGNTIRGSVFATGARESQQASNFTQDLKDQGLSVANKFKTNWDFNPGIGGPLMKDQLWYYYTYRNNGIYNYAAGMFFNFNEFTDPRNIWTYQPNPARPALAAHGDWYDSQLRLTWQANAKNKLAGTWDQQYHCRCPNSVDGVTSPEAAFDRRFPTQRLLHGEWWSPLTSKLLLEFVALHRTERWGNMELRGQDQGGSLTITPAQYALYPQMIGVTQTNGTVDVPNGLRFHGPNGVFNNNYVPNYTYRAAVSYITGAHSLKIGMQDSFGYVTSTTYLNTLDAQNRPVRYRFASQNTPDQVTVFQQPWTTKSDQNHDLGIFVQDRWTMDRLTLNGGARFDWYNSEVPGQVLAATTIGRPETHYDGILNTVNWRDITPRVGASYDVTGDGKTALKAYLNKYVGGQALGGLPGSANPIARLTSSSSRTWNDLNGDKVVNCDLNNRFANGECTNNGAAPTAAQLAAGCSDAAGALGCTVPVALVDQSIRSSADGGALWNTRGYNWEFSVGMQREILPRVSVDVSYFRRWYGNFTATDNQAVAPTDFDRIDVVAPLDSRLPAGGGNLITSYVDPKTAAIAARTAVNQVLLTDSIGANQIQHWNGIDVGVNARLQNGLLLQGGTSTGRQYTNTCEVSALLPETLGNNPQSFCEQTEPFRTQIKAVASYTLPRYSALPNTMALLLESVQLGATFQSIPGDFKSATYTMPNGEFCVGGAAACDPAQPTFGTGTSTFATRYSDLAGTQVIAPRFISNTGATGNKTIALIQGSTVVDERQNQLDLRVGKIVRFGRTRTSLNFDIFNVTNANTVLSRNNSFSKTPSYNAATGIGINNSVTSLWAPTSILQARFYKISATFDF